MFSKEGLIKPAIECGLLEDESPHTIPETLGALKSLADAATETIFENPDGNGLSIQVIQKAFYYAFAKGLEMFYLMQAAKDQITLSYSEADLLSGHLAAPEEQNAADFFNDAMGKCAALFSAFQEWLKTNQDLFQGGFLDLYDELDEALNWSSRIGLSYAVSKLSIRIPCVEEKEI